MMRLFSRRLVTGLGFLMACGGASEEPQEGSLQPFGEDLVVTLLDGRVQGDAAGESARFLKIPYAKPPLGELRWKAPVKNEPWQGVRHEGGFAAPCAQLENSQGPTSTNEDCLYLNVWAPVPVPEHAPVMVWIHGGGNFAGSAGDKVPLQVGAENAPLFYDGQTFASKQRVVLVSLNYRLGPFGFFSHPALGDEGSPRGNQGLLDQNAALQWVRDNIEAFGGDPNNVTIFGESAGSADVCYHVVSPKSAGLFQRAISESGGCTAGPTGDRDSKVEASSAGMLAFASALGCTPEAGLACLRDKSVEELLAHGMQPDPSGGFFDKKEWKFSVVIDGEGGFLPSSPRELFAAGTVNKVPYLLGSNTDEGTLFLLTTAVSDEAAYQAALEEGYGELAPQLAALYPASKYNGDYKAALARVVGDSGLVCGTHDSARRAAKAGLPVYMYNFNVPWTVAFGILGAAHGSEISHVFGSPYNADSTSQHVGDVMNTFWAQFARTGDPNFQGAPAAWPRFEPSADGADLRIQLDSAFGTLDSFRKEECGFWRSVYDARAASAD